MIAPASVDVDGVAFDALSAEQLVAEVCEGLRTGIGGVVATINVDHLREFRSSADFRRVTNAATHRIADGMPIIWLGRLLQTPLPERVAGSDLIEQICAAIASQGASIAIIGGPEGVGDTVAQRLALENPGLEVAMVQAPPIGFEADADLMKSLRAELRSTRPDFVFVAIGMPRQELLIANLRDELPTAWWMGVGAGIEFLAGTQTRAPELMQRTGLEWLHRLVSDPKRLVHRYLVKDMPYLAGATFRSVKQRVAATDRPVG